MWAQFRAYLNSNQVENLVMYQVNTKGDKVAKIGGCSNEREAVEFAVRIVIRAKKMQPKEGAAYLRTLGVSRLQPIYFDYFKSSRLQRLGKIRLGSFLDKYELATMYAILEDIKGAK